MFHLLGYFESIDNTANIDVAAMTDDVFPKIGDHYQFLQDIDIVAAYAGAANLDRARINSPTLRIISPQYIRPVNTAILTPTNPNVADWIDQPFSVPTGEEVAIEMTATAAGPQNAQALLWVTDRIDPVPNDNVHDVRATSTGTAVVNVWTTISYTFDQALPSGTYNLVGSRVISTNAIAHRWILPGQLWRPGALSCQGVSHIPHQIFVRRRLGVFGRFVNVNLPQLQVLCNVADNAHTIYMELQKVG